MEQQAPHAQWAVVTHGAAGCVAIGRKTDDDDGEESMMPASFSWQEHAVPAVDLGAGGVVDSTGAGDAFLGGMAACIVRDNYESLQCCFPAVFSEAAADPYTVHVGA